LSLLEDLCFGAVTWPSRSCLIVDRRGSISLYQEAKATIHVLPLPTLVEISDHALAIARRCAADRRYLQILQCRLIAPLPS
jgi:hypothetical protein